MAIDKKTKKVLKTLEKDHNCIIQVARKRQTIYVLAPKKSIDPYNIHVGHLTTDKTYKPLICWARKNFNLK